MAAHLFNTTNRGVLHFSPSWQAKAGKDFAKQNFRIDWDRQQVICPAGVASRSWLPNREAEKNYSFLVRWAKRDCRDCAYRTHCTTRTNEEPRELFLMDRTHQEATDRARVRQTTATFARTYALRAGVESAHAQAIRRCDLRHARYRGLAKTRFQHVLTATALNLIRVSAWLADTPRAQPAGHHLHA